MALIKGILKNASGVRPNTKIILIAQKTSASVIQHAPDFMIVTDANGAYSFECNSCRYQLIIMQSGCAREQVGYINVYDDSQSGTLEQYLTEWNHDDLTPDVVARVEALEASAKQSAINAENSAKQAQAAADKTAQQVIEAGEAQVTEATAQAVKAKASADKASQITGLDTVEQAVQAALADSYQYAMTKADFDANREANKLKYAGSGFVEFGKHYISQYETNINQGMFAYTQLADSLFMGRQNDPVGISKTHEPVVCVDGTVLHLTDIAGDLGAQNTIKFPPAPNGTKSYDSETGIVTDHLTYLDPKYDNTPATDHNDAVSRCFEGLCKNGDFRLGTEGWGSDNATLTPADNKATVTSTATNGQCIARYSAVQGEQYAVEFYVESLVGSSVIYLLQSDTVMSSGTVKLGKNTVTFTHTDPSISRSQFVVRPAQTGDSCTFSNISIRPVTNKVITTRKDLVFLEVWHEDVSDKGVLVPLGNVQYGATTWNGIPLKKLTELGVGQGYSAFGEWDKDTVGYGVRISDLTDAQLKKFLQDPKNNIYFDAETGKLIQVRYRIRVVEGLGDEWENVQNTKKLNSGLRYSSSNRPSAQGTLTVSKDFGFGSGFYIPNVNPEDTESFAFVTANSETRLYGSKCFALPIALVQRLNQGAYHPVFNPSGCRAVAFQRNNTNYDGNYWYIAASKGLDVSSTMQCFKMNAWSSTFTGASGYSPSGYISSTSTPTTGRPTNDPYPYYDAIYAGQVEDLRLSAHKQDVNKLRVDAMRKAVAGEMRGKGKIPFCFASTSTEGASVSTGRILSDIDPNLKAGDFAYIQTTTGYAHKTLKAVDHTLNTVNWNGALDAPANAKVITHSWLAPSFDELPWTDIIGSPENIAAAFPNGVVGQWIPEIPDGTSKKFPFNRKNAVKGAITITNNNGSSWTTQEGREPSVTNLADDGSVPTNNVKLFTYSTLSNFTESANNSVVVGDVGDVFATSSSDIRIGVRIAESLIAKVCKDSTAKNKTHFIGMTNYGIWTPQGHFEVQTANKHNPLQLIAPVNDSPAVKALSTITEKDGLLYLQLHGSELHYDTTAGNWGDNSTIPIINYDGTRTDDNGHVVKTFCHHSMIPLGIASYSDSSQSTK